MTQNRSLHPALVRYYFYEMGDVKRVLDLGCGVGSLGRYKPSEEIEVHGLDANKYAVAEASRFEKAMVWDLDGGMLPFDADFFDAVLAKDILEHLQRPWLIVGEICRVLKPGGLVLASVPMPKPRIVWSDYTHIRGYTREALRTMFEEVGFEVMHIKKMGGVPLAGRLNLVRYIPLILSLPLLGCLYGRSYEIKARKPDEEI